MNFFLRLKNNLSAEDVLRHIEVNYEPGRIYAPIAGEYIPLSEVEDPAFSSGMLGSGCGIRPLEGKVYAPVSGKVVSIASTKHFIGVETEAGNSFLLHIGMDTVELQGKGFRVFTSEGSLVNCGDLLMTFDMEMIRKKGYVLTSALVAAEPAQVRFEVERTGSCCAGEKIGRSYVC